MKKVLSTIGLAVVLAGSTFANGGIIVAGKGETTPTGCTSRDGIIVAGRDGIIVAGKDIIGIIVAGLTGVTVVGDGGGCTSTERDGIIITD
jgi:hypothetical protein